MTYELDATNIARRTARPILKPDRSCILGRWCHPLENFQSEICDDSVLYYHAIFERHLMNPSVNLPLSVGLSMNKVLALFLTFLIFDYS